MLANNIVNAVKEYMEAYRRYNTKLNEFITAQPFRPEILAELDKLDQELKEKHDNWRNLFKQ